MRRARRVLRSAGASRMSSSASCASPRASSAHLHLSWLDPHKERRFTVVGSERMATFDDMALEGKLTVYDKGVRRGLRAATANTSRARGDIFSPRIPNVGAAADRVRALHRLHPPRSAAPRSDGDSGLRVVRVLEQLQRSLENSAGTARDSQAASTGRRVRSLGRRAARRRRRRSSPGAVIHAGVADRRRLRRSASGAVLHAGHPARRALRRRGRRGSRQAAAPAPGLERAAGDRVDLVDARGRA